MTLLHYACTRIYVSMVNSGQGSQLVLFLMSLCSPGLPRLAGSWSHVVDVFTYTRLDLVDQTFRLQKSTYET